MRILQSIRELNVSFKSFEGILEGLSHLFYVMTLPSSSFFEVINSFNKQCDDETRLRKLEPVPGFLAKHKVQKAINERVFKRKRGKREQKKGSWEEGERGVVGFGLKHT